MRHIVKGSEPSEFTAWKALANQDWQPSSWRDLQNPEKAAVLRSLLEEQGYLCCYCEDLLGGIGDSHIEHVESRHRSSHLTFDYGNLLACCNFRTSKDSGGQEPPHCGHAKGDDPLPVHPLMPDCRSHFEFTSTGEILPRTEGVRGQAAERTIKLLKLDLPILEARRREAITGMFDGDPSDDELRAFAASLDKRDSEGRLSRFCSALTRVLEKYLPPADATPLARDEDER